jgi:hypothetical protein
VGGILGNWSPYVLLISGALAMFVASNAFQAGTLAASQPGLTIVDPVVSSALGVVLFSEYLRHGPADLVGEAVALLVLVASVVLLSRSPLVHEAATEPNESDPDQRANGHSRTRQRRSSGDGWAISGR